MEKKFANFKNGLGKRFRVEGFFRGEFAKPDIIRKVNENTGEVEGDKFIAHYKDCRFVNEPPPQFSKNKVTI
jgi:hypothetical protein